MESQVNNINLLEVAEMQLVYRNKIKASLRPSITRADDAYKIFLNNWDEDRIEMVEQFKIMVLNRANKVLGIFEVSTGGTTGTVVDLKLIFSAALHANASAIILAHNHPSENLKPSEADKTITSKIVDAGKLLDIQVLDHLIITTEGFFSFADEGLL